MNPNGTFERDLERWLQAEAPASAPAGLHAAVIDRARTMRQRRSWTSAFPARWFGRNRGITLLAAAALLVVGGAAAAGAGLLRLPSAVPPQPAPSLAVVQPPSPSVEFPSPMVSPTPAPTEAPSAVPARAPSWTATGSMITPRSGSAAVLMPDGKVLAVGGVNGNKALASAELYDPGTGTWTATGSMVSHAGAGAGYNHFTATLLRDGKVLVAGGVSGKGFDLLASAELYDPGTGTWTATGSMLTPRSSHTATLLSDGRVLVAGGQPRSPVASAELYDPVTGTWTATDGSMATTRPPRPTAIMMADKPTPAQPCTASHSPAMSRPCATTARYAVANRQPRPAATVESRSSGMRTRLTAARGTTTASANEPQ